MIQNRPFRSSLLAFLISLFLSMSLQGQKDLLNRVNHAFENADFITAIMYLDRIEKLSTSGPLLFKHGVCQYELNRLDLAMADFKRAWEYGYTEKQIDWYTAQIYHHKGEFARAAVSYKKYLQHLDDEQESEKEKVRNHIKQCGNAIDLAYKRPIALVENFSREVNSVYDEQNLFESPGKENTYYFSSNNPRKKISLQAADFNIYSVVREDRGSQTPERLSSAINRYTDEYLQGFSPDGLGIYFMRRDKQKTELMLNRQLSGAGGSRVMAFPSEFSGKYIDVHIYDRNLIVYSDNTVGGYGGYDLYMSVQKEGKWSAGINLGPHINGPYNEISPYLNGDGSILYFSSDRPESIGAYDIFRSEYLYEAGNWSPAQNMGIPLNSPGDELHFRPMEDGLRASFSSNRKSAIGGFDIFLARFMERMPVPYYNGEVACISYIADNSGDEDLADLPADMMEDSVVPESGLKLQIATNARPDLKTLYYTNESELLNKANLSTLQQLARYLTDNPLLKLELEVHSAEQDNAEMNLLASIRIGGRIESFLESEGIDEARVSIKALGSLYPLVKKDRSLRESTASGYNSRVELTVINPDSSTDLESYSDPEISDRLLSLKYPLYRILVRDEISYRVELAVVNELFPGFTLENLNDIAIEEHQETGMFSFTAGLYASYSKALQVKRELERNGFTHTQVIAYYNGIRLAKDQLTFLVKDHPDLKNFMNYQD